MSELLVKTSAELSAALTAARGGDVIRLAAGNYGDVTISSKNFTTDVTITSADATNLATFHSLYVKSSSGLVFDDVNVNFTPTATTTSTSSAVRVLYSHDITFQGGVVNGGPAINGVSPTATTLDSTGNVLGMPAGRGFTLDRSSDITIENVDIHTLHRGMVLANSSDLRIRGNEIHGLRTSPIVGGGVNHVIIEGNHLTESRPWRWGSGDHADFIHLWTSPDSQTGPTTDIQILNNAIEQGDGTAILGIYLDDDGTGFGFSGVKITNNLILNGNGQGVRLENVFDSIVADNTLLQTSGTASNAPGIKLHGPSHNVTVTGNVAAYVIDGSGLVNNLHDNFLVQKFDPTKAGYYTDTLVDQVDDLSPTVAHQTVLADLDADATTVTDVKLTVATDAGGSLLGGAGNDTLVGRNGGDVLNGAGGNDYLTGNGGNDTLVGGTGADKFVFGGSYVSSGGTDTVMDFSHAQGDRLHLHSIDAKTTVADNQAFTFIGATAFHKVAGELRYQVSGSDSYVQGDVNGDGVADFSIKVVGVGTLVSADFTL